MPKAGTKDTDALIDDALARAQLRERPKRLETAECRTVVLTGDVADAMVQTAAEQLGNLTAGSNDPITVILSTGGGTMADGWALHDLFATNDAPVLTIGYGLVGSAGTIAFLGGRMRLLAPNTLVMVHQTARLESEGNQVTTTKMKELSRHMDKLQARMERFYAMETENSIATVRGWMSKDTYFTARRAVALGFADGVLGLVPRPEKKPKTSQKRPRKA